MLGAAVAILLLFSLFEAKKLAVLITILLVVALVYIGKLASLKELTEALPQCSIRECTYSSLGLNLYYWIVVYSAYMVLKEGYPGYAAGGLLHVQPGMQSYPTPQPHAGAVYSNPYPAKAPAPAPAVQKPAYDPLRKY